MLKFADRTKSPFARHVLLFSGKFDMSRCGRLLCSLPVLIAALWAIRPACAGPVSAHAEPIVGDSPTAMVNANEDTAWAPVIPMPDVPAPLADSSFTTGVQPFVVPMRPAPSSEGARLRSRPRRPELAP